jgi:hypothetical protein
MNILGRILLIVPFCKLLYDYIPSLDFYSLNYPLGAWLLILLGLISILFNISRILGIIYILVGYGLYSYFIQSDIYSLWPVGGLILLIRSDVSKKVVVEKVVPVKKKVVVEKVVPVKINKTKSDEYWERYEARNKKNLFFNLKDKFNKLLVAGW